MARAPFTFSPFMTMNVATGLESGEKLFASISIGLEVHTKIK